MKRLSIVLVALAVVGAALATPAQALTCGDETRIFVQEASNVGAGTQSTHYNFDRSPYCSNGAPMANTTFLKLDSAYTTFVETGSYQSNSRSTAFVEYNIYPSATYPLHYWSEFRTAAVPKYQNLSYAISKRSDTSYNIFLDLSGTQSNYDNWYVIPATGYSYGRPESEISRYGDGNMSGNYNTLRYRRTSDATWQPWANLSCDTFQTNATDWRVQKVSNTEWYSTHLAPASGGCS